MFSRDRECKPSSRVECELLIYELGYICAALAQHCVFPYNVCLNQKFIKFQEKMKLVILENLILTVVGLCKFN
jgi:hypothetical protein